MDRLLHARDDFGQPADLLLKFIPKGGALWDEGGLTSFRALASYAGLRHSTTRKVFFAAYTPPQKTEWIFFAALRRRELCETYFIN